MDLMTTIKVSSAGMRAQQDRLNIVAQNLANVDSVGTREGADPYRRQTISFKNEVDKETGAMLVKTSKVGTDRSPFPIKFEPENPEADANGYVRGPNVNSVREMMDMREARRSYEANVNMIETSKTMLGQTLSLLR